MTKLYYNAISCSASVFIAANITGVKLDTTAVNLQTHITQDDVDFYKISPRGMVPYLVLDDGTGLTEMVANLLWVTDQKPGILSPPAGTSDYRTLVNTVSYIATEIHPGIGVFFAKESADALPFLKARAATRLAYLENEVIGNKQFLVGNKLSVADIYMSVVLAWAFVYQTDKIEVSAYPKVKAFYERITGLENVKTAVARMAAKATSTV